MGETGFTKRDVKRVAELAHIWEKMQEEDEALGRTAKLARLYMALVAAVFMPTVVLSGGNPLLPPFNWIFFGSAVIFLYGAARLFGWYATALRRLAKEFQEKYGEELRRLEASEDARQRSDGTKDPFL